MQMEIINTHDAKTRLSQLLERVAQGEEFLIAKAGRPIAKLSGLDASTEPRKGGQWRGLVQLGPDFDAPLPPDIAGPLGALNEEGTSGP